ncbi:MAG: hypothetical protein JNN11_01420 [Candidatus Doudnabacteria bacterium]|nr:hypothetical protein [Candidatus Doudnabacteria bacterium]
MKVKDMFLVGEIMEWEDKPKSIKVLSYDDCIITSKILNKRKIILHVERQADNSEGNVFVRLDEKYESEFVVFKKMLSSKNIIGKSLNEFREMEVEEL